MPAVVKAESPRAALSAKLRSLLLDKIAAGKLALPAMPATAAKVLECVENGAHNDRAATLLEGDPALALEVLRLANSGAFAPRSRINSISHALNVLGATRVKSLLMAATARQIFVSRNREIRDLAQMLWTHSLAVAELSRQIAVRAAFTDKESPYLAGLLHDAGKPVVAIHLLDLERSLARGAQDRWIEPTDWLGIVQDVHAPIGVAIAKHWNLAPEVCKAIEDSVEYDPIDRLSAPNAVRFANAIAKREGIYAGNVDAEQNDTVIMIGRSMLGLDDEAVRQLAGGARSAARE